MGVKFNYFILLTATVTVYGWDSLPAGNNVCGCKVVRACYSNMLVDLQEKDEQICLDDVEVGTSTYLVYFKALNKYCNSIVNVTTEYMTSESRSLFEVSIHFPKGRSDHVPIIFMEAGQSAGIEPVRVVLSFIERLVACEENDNMISNVRWIFLPCTNPDGLEYVRFDRPDWDKNTRKTGDGLSYGIDISKNFDAHWNECEKTKSMLDLNYPGPSPASEVETKFIRNTLLKYKEDIKVYLSVRRYGHHGLLYPHAFSDKADDIEPRQIKIAGLVSLKVNQRGGNLQAFVNDSIYRVNGRPFCGNSVDYAHSQGIQLPYEFRVGFEKDMQILENFQYIPKSAHTTLIASYFSGIRELHAIISANRDA